MMPGILVIDGGTTSFKAAIFDERLRLRGVASREFEILRPTSDRAELDPQSYWSSCADAVREALRASSLDARQIAAIAVTSHTDTLFALDADGKPLTNAILWSDPRAQPQAEHIQRQMGRQAIYRATGQTGASSVHFAARLAWFRENQSDAARKTRHFLQTQDFLIFCLSGQTAVDHSVACCSLLAYLERPEYWPAMLDLVDVEVETLSRIVPPGKAVGNLKSDVAGILGLPAGIPVIPAAMDATAANVAIGSMAPDSVTDTTGAALVIGVTCDAPTFDPHICVPCFAHALPGKYLLLPWCETGGAALRWYRDTFFAPAAQGPDSPAGNLYERISAEAAEAPPGSDGVILLPHFAGSGCPDFNPAAKACIYGLTMGHQRKHISRAFLESVAYLLKRNLDLLAGMGVSPASITCAGGGSHSALWCQIKADVTGLPVRVCPFPEATAVGAAMLASRALGWSSQAAVSQKETDVPATFQPNLSVAADYQKAFEQFTWLDNALRPAPAVQDPSG
jgi:sugar (pentulose or hexulose) kinase